MVYSHLQCCIIVWGQASKCVLDPIEKLHKRIKRIMTRQPFLTSSLPLFYQLNYLKISDIFKLEVTKLMLIAGESLDKPQFHSITPVAAQHNYNTRHSVKNNYIYYHKYRLTLESNCFNILAPGYGKKCQVN